MKRDGDSATGAKATKHRAKKKVKNMTTKKSKTAPKRQTKKKSAHRQRKRYSNKKRAPKRSEVFSQGEIEDLFGEVVDYDPKIKNSRPIQQGDNVWVIETRGQKDHYEIRYGPEAPTSSNGTILKADLTFLEATNQGQEMSKEKGYRFKGVYYG